MIVGSCNSTVTNEVPSFSAWLYQMQRMAGQRTSKQAGLLNVRNHGVTSKTRAAHRRAFYDSRGWDLHADAPKMRRAWNDR
jgi:hypothetical protein